MHACFHVLTSWTISGAPFISQSINTAIMSLTDVKGASFPPISRWGSATPPKVWLIIAAIMTVVLPLQGMGEAGAGSKMLAWQRLKAKPASTAGS